MFVGNIISIWAVVVEQLVEWSLPMSQVRGSNPIIGILLYQTFICLEEIEKKQRTNIFAIKVYVLLPVFVHIHFHHVHFHTYALTIDILKYFLLLLPFPFYSTLTSISMI